MGKVVADFQTPPSLTPPEGDVSFNSINNTPIGGVTPSSGAFTTLSASTSATLPQDTTVGGANVPSALASRTPSQSLLFPGTQGRSTATLPVSTISGARTFYVSGLRVPSVNPSAFEAIFLLSSDGAESACSTHAYFLSNGRLSTGLYGITGEWRVAQVVDFISTYGGQTVNLWIVQPATGDIEIRVNGRVVGYETVVSSGGAPDWNGELHGPYLDIGRAGNAGYPLSGALGAVSVFNRAVTAAEIAACETTGTLPADCFPATPAGTELITGDNSTGDSDTGFWAKDGGATIGSGAFTLPAGATIISPASPAIMSIGTRYAAFVSVTSLTAGNIRFTDYSAFVGPTITTAGDYWFYFTAAGARLQVLTTGGEGVLATVRLMPAGTIFSPDADQPGYGSTWRDVSGWNADLAIASGVTWGRKSSGDVQVDTITGVASGITLNASGTNQNVTLVPSGTGNAVVQLANATDFANLTNAVHITGADLKILALGVTGTHAGIQSYSGDLHLNPVGNNVVVGGSVSISATATATAVNTGAFKSPNFGFSGNLGGPAFLGGALGVAGVLTHAGTFAGIHVHDASTAQTIATGTAYAKITAFTDNDPSNDCTADAANDKITITRAGIYKVGGSASFYSDTNNVTWKATAFLDGVEQDNVHWERKIGTGADLGNAAFSGFIDVTSVPVDLDLRMRHDQAGDVALTITYSNLNASFEGNT